MEQTAQHHKQVEDRVDIALVFLLADHIEHGADGVGHTTQYQEDGAAQADGLGHGLPGHHHAPAHGQVADHGEHLEALHVDGGEDDTDDRRAQTTPNSVQPIFGFTPRRAQSAKGV